MQDFALFGAKVLAEVPDSIRQLCPNMSRFIDGSFIQPQFGSNGSLIFAHVRVGDELVPRLFVAKSMKLVFPIELVMESGMFARLSTKGELGPQPIEKGDSFPRVIPSSQRASLKCPSSGPPREFFDRFGTPTNCGACHAMDMRGTRQCLSHSKECRTRYERWLKIQIGGADDEHDMDPRDGKNFGGSDYEPSLPPAIEEASNKEDIFGTAEVADSGAGTQEKGSNDLEKLDLSDLVDGPKVKRARIFTRRCPACESGMNVPGIRHNKECQRNQNQSTDVDIPKVGTKAKQALADVSGTTNDEQSGEDAAMEEIVAVHEETDLRHENLLTDPDSEVVLNRTNLKRTAETATEDLEKEINQDMQKVGDSKAPKGSSGPSASCVDDGCVPLSALVSSAFVLSEYVPLLNGLLDSVRFDPNATSVVVPFGSLRLRIWHPVSAVDDSTMLDLPGDQTFRGMIKEVENLNLMKTGDLLTAEGVEELKIKHPQVEFRVIGCRWVTVRKTPDTVRARIVVKDIAGKASQSARALGISSPTPSADSLFLLLAVAGERDFCVGAADVAHAFMATPLRVRDTIIRLPLSVSGLQGEPAFLHLGKALNGLRKSSQDWICFLSEIVAGIGTGLKSCPLEPCLFTGLLQSGPCALLVYVDDLLLIAPSEKDIDLLFTEIGRRVDLKQTGLLKKSSDGGGVLTFLGRVVTRRKKERQIMVSLPSDYLDGTFKDYGLVGKGTQCPPDVAVHVEKVGGTALTPEAFARFRSALGRVAWMSQTRQDLRAYISILATQQSCPSNYTEQGLRGLLRYLQNDMNVAVRLPSSSPVLFQQDDFKDQPHMVCFSDASHAPLRSTKRRGISGGVLTVFGATIRTLSRCQQMVSLSSMESELFALQMVAQEMTSLGRAAARMLHSFNETTLNELPGVLFTDSESSLKLLRNLDVPKRSRHLEIRIEWLKARVEEGHLVLTCRKGENNPSDMLTKCLGSSLFNVHRESLGFETMQGPVHSLVAIGHRMIMVEVCCRP